jgi:hypothetical protein
VLTGLEQFRSFSEYQCAKRALSNENVRVPCGGDAFYMNVHHHNDRDHDDFHHVYGNDGLLSYHECGNDCVYDVNGGDYYVP